MHLAKQQQDEFHLTDDDEQPMPARSKRVSFQGATNHKGDDSDDDDDDDDMDSFDGDYEDDTNFDIEEQEILNKFMPPSMGERRTLADMIMEKIQQHEMQAQPSEQPAQQAQPAASQDLNPQIVHVYTQVGELLSRYKSGKLPKAFKIIPTLANWEHVMWLTRPDKWTPHATHKAVKIFLSNLKGNNVQRFYNTVLLNKVRQDLDENKKLNYHLYLALRRALYKPAAFFKGVLFPLCEDGCSLREATVFASLLAKTSIPVLHSSAALLHIAEMDYSGPNSLVIRVLLDKKYALPFKVLEALVQHFYRFVHDERTMPVLWQQSLLVFCQRYKLDLSPDQRRLIQEVVKSKFHDKISPEIRRELGEATRNQQSNDMDMD
jgi:essential nuclear protein 1